MEEITQEVAVEQPSNLVPQEQVNRVVAREKASAYEKGKRESEAQYQQQLAELRAQQEQRNSQVPKDVDANAIYQQVREQFNRDQEALKQKMEEEQYRQKIGEIAQNYSAKMASGKNYFEDFDEVMKDHDPSAFPQLTVLLAGMDNAAPIMYELMKNPNKLATINYFAEKNPRMAQNQLLSLSQSINANKQAQAEAQEVAQPLDRLQPSRIAGNNNKATIRDLRNQSWLRG